MAIIKRKGVRRKRIVLQDPETSQAVGDLIDDVELINARAVPMLLRSVVNETYTEPMRLALPYNPDAILLLRAQRTRDPELAPVLCGGFVEYFWRVASTGGYAEIRSIDGLTPSDVRYSFKFLIVGKHDPSEQV